MTVAFHNAAYSDEQKDYAALDLVAAVAFGPTSELYQRLVLTEQKVDQLNASNPERMDPHLFTVTARVKDGKDVDYVRDQILATVERFTREAIPQKKLDDTRSRLRYETALGFDSSQAIADAVAPFLALRRTPETMDRLFAVYDTITPEDARAMAAKYLTEQKRTIVTLATKAGSAAAKTEGGK